MKFSSDKVVEIIGSISKNKSLNLHEPDLDKRDFFHLKKCFDSGMISTAGDYVEKFENQLKKITQSKYAILVSSGTTGLFMSLLALDIKKDDEVLVPAVSFVATANAIMHCGAVPHFVDVEKKTFGIDSSKLEQYLLKNTLIKNNKCLNKKTKRHIKAIILVHIFGHPCNLSEIIKVSKKFNLLVIEDAAEAIGSHYKKKHVGNFGKIGVFSFNGNKIVTCGGGGAIITNQKKLFIKIKHLISTAKVKHKWRYIHDNVGYNFRLPAINAAIGYSQLLKLNVFIKKKTKIYKMYKEKFKKITDIKILPPPKNCKSNFWLQTLILSDKQKRKKNDIIKKCHARNIKVRPLWDLISSFKMYRNFPKMNLCNSKYIYDRVINLPSSSFLIK